MSNFILIRIIKNNILCERRGHFIVTVKYCADGGGAGPVVGRNLTANETSFFFPASDRWIVPGVVDDARRTAT